MPDELPQSTRRQIVSIWRTHFLYCLVFASAVSDIAARYNVKVEAAIIVFIIAIFFAFAMTESFDFILTSLFRQAAGVGDDRQAYPDGNPPKHIEAHGRRYLLLPETSTEKRNGGNHE